MHRTPREAPRPRLRMPSLDLLKGFEAAARHLSFTRAAEELYLTQSALSRQIQTLEEQLGIALFERRHRALLLTEAGQILLATTKTVLGEVEQAVARMRHEQAARPVTLSTAIPSAALWLLPRLPQFRARHPELEIYISADNRMLDLDRERIDLAVRYCPEPMAPPGAQRLFGERLQPVCSPSLATDRARPLKRPEDLARHVLLHLEDERGRFPWLNWGQWFAAIGMAQTAGAGALRFNQFDLLIQAAIDGQGVALGRSPLVDRLLEQKKLVAPFHNTHATTRAYFIVRSAASAKRPEAQAVVDWLVAAAEESRAAAKPLPARSPKRRR
jgi:LysR family transcriptional regulator, glycine cleavage system transcriptional activator